MVLGLVVKAGEWEDESEERNLTERAPESSTRHGRPGPSAPPQSPDSEESFPLGSDDGIGESDTSDTTGRSLASMSSGQGEGSGSDDHDIGVDRDGHVRDGGPSGDVRVDTTETRSQDKGVGVWGLGFRV